jgi:hypothetical protein
MAILLTVCGLIAAIVGSWSGYASARTALGPIVHDGDQTRTAVETDQPIYRRSRFRLVVHRVLASLGWLVVAGYGLFLAAVGSSLA